MGVEPKIVVGFSPPKWMVKIMENPIKIRMIWGGPTPIFGNTHIPGVSLLKIQVPNVSRAAQPNGALPLIEVWMECLRFLQI